MKARIIFERNTRPPPRFWYSPMLTITGHGSPPTCCSVSFDEAPTPEGVRNATVYSADIRTLDAPAMMAWMLGKKFDLRMAQRDASIGPVVARGEFDETA